MTVKSKHHHGDLRAALVRAGVDLIAEGGPDALSIRKAAAMAGVSHAAPAHHFPTLVHLRTAVAAEGFRRFAEVIEEEMAAACDDPQDQIIAASLGYLTFAQRHPGLFEVMYRCSSILADEPDFKRSSARAYELLHRVCAPLAPNPAGPTGNEMLLWSLMHGYATLTLARVRGGFDEGDPRKKLKALFPRLPLKLAEK